MFKKIVGTNAVGELIYKPVTVISRLMKRGVKSCEEVRSVQQHSQLLR